MSHADRWSTWLSHQLGGLSERDQLRSLHALEPVDATHVRRDGRPVVVFSSNDYLGLSSHTAVRDAAAEAARVHGLGPRGSPLVCGYTSAHEQLEQRLAQLKHAETSLLFSSGFAANAATLASLADDDLTIFSDALNHASIIDGCRLAQ